MAEQIYDVTFRMRFPTGSKAEVTGKWLKTATRDAERQKVQEALMAFWAPHAYKQKGNEAELTEIALEAVLELTEQILQIALLADLPIEQLNFKTQVLSLVQQTKGHKTKASQATKALSTTQAESNGSDLTSEPVKAKPKAETPQEVLQEKTPGKQKRKTLFTD